MKGIIIAAGPGSRFGQLTQDIPKCMLPIDNKPMIQNTLDLFNQNGIDDISVVRGYKKEKINLPNITYFDNTDFMNNNILHSLLHARPKLEEAIRTKEDVVISYSDIIYTPEVVKSLVESPHAITSTVDIAWEKGYFGRTDHPIQEAENVIMDTNNKKLKIGKYLTIEDMKGKLHGEFIGLWKFTAAGIQLFLKHIDRLNRSLKLTDPFQHSKEWQKAYITDIFQEMVDQGEELYCSLIEENWTEFDTIQDYERYKKKREV